MEVMSERLGKKSAFTCSGWVNMFMPWAEEAREFEWLKNAMFESLSRPYLSHNDALCSESAKLC